MKAHVIINITFDKYYYVELEEKEHEIIIEILENKLSFDSFVKWQSKFRFIRSEHKKIGYWQIRFRFYPIFLNLYRFICWRKTEIRLL